MRMITLSTLLTIGVLLPDLALAQAVSNSMTCQQAISYYERNGRIQTSSGNTTVPIYGYAPASRRNQMGCTPSAVTVKTSDQRRCAIAYKCAPRGR